MPPSRCLFTSKQKHLEHPGVEVDAGERALDYHLGGVAIVDRLKGAVLEIGCKVGS